MRHGCSRRPTGGRADARAGGDSGRAGRVRGPRGSLASLAAERRACSRTRGRPPRAQSAFVPPARPVQAGWSRPRAASPGRPVTSRASPGSVNKRSVAAPPEGPRGRLGSASPQRQRSPPFAQVPSSPHAGAWRPSPPAARSWPPTTTTGVSKPLAHRPTVLTGAPRPAAASAPAPGEPLSGQWARLELTRLSSPGRLGSTSSNSSCGSAECPGEAIPHHPGECRPPSPLPLASGGRPRSGQQHHDPAWLLSGLPKADPGHWWASFFFGKSTLPFMATVLESPEQ